MKTRMTSKLVCSLVTIGALAAALFAPGSARADWFDCKPYEVLEYNSRVHVRCSNTIPLNGNTVRYITIGTSDTNKVKRFVGMATAALMGSLTFLADIPASADSNVSGCSASDCRTATVFGISR